MKKFRLFFLLILVTTLVSCSSDDSSNDTEEVVSNHFPLTVGNSWTYNNETAYEDGTFDNSQETISVASSNEAQGVTYYSLTSNLPPLQQGFVTGILTNGELTAADNQLIYNGELSINLSEMGIPDAENLTIPLVNVIMFDADANTGNTLTADLDNSFTQSIPVQGTDIPFTFEYDLETFQGDFLESYTTNEMSFEDVFSADIIVTIEINANFSGITIPVLDSQEAIQITNYYADNVGMIYSETAINYNFEAINLPTVPEIPDYSVNYSQTIESYTIVEE
ncbi:hypothetical protein [Mesonia mobilis]|uniref:Uncharacterized protein n=1 Tax=Mesonia mobilis TaxID=369791 RepID=A0ABQ3BQC2_9FLAO|nr:hypothetical protein [Mesonia mobilis]MBQ0736925.1 hypothetical protein [Aquimarina celericrescens]GGZ49590.1 hypothetical protein GCM10008088_08780 [Mesonia mobilis]